MRALQKELEELQEDGSACVSRNTRKSCRSSEIAARLWKRRDNGGSGVSVLLSPLLPTLIRLSRPILSSSGNYSLTCKGSWKSLQNFHGVMTN